MKKRKNSTDNELIKQKLENKTEKCDTYQNINPPEQELNFSAEWSLYQATMAQKYWLRQAEVQTTTQILQPFKSCRVPISFNRRQKRNGRAQFTQRLRRFYGVTTFFLVGAIGLSTFYPGFP
uniref:Uncharacterized protein n=1 Tax=Glossina austeni TaxID=7395 RepID=A0A1A9UDM1_GLOAU